MSIAAGPGHLHHERSSPRYIEIPEQIYLSVYCIDIISLFIIIESKITIWYGGNYEMSYL